VDRRFNSILTIFFDFSHLLSRLNLIVCGAFFVRWNDSIAHHCSNAPRRELPREPLPTNRVKAPIQTLPSVSARLLPPTAAIMSSGHDPSNPSEIGYLPVHALTVRQHPTNVRQQHPTNVLQHPILHVSAPILNKNTCTYLLIIQ
jgi:hypothetical protein